MKLLEKTAVEFHATFLDGNIVVKRTKRRFNQVLADQATGWITRTCKMHNGSIGSKGNTKPEIRLCYMVRTIAHLQETRSLFNLEDDDEKTVFCRSDSLLSRTRRGVDDVKRLATQFRAFNVPRLTMKSAEKDGDTHSETMDKPLVSMATKDTAQCEVVSDRLLQQKEICKQSLSLPI